MLNAGLRSVARRFVPLVPPVPPTVLASSINAAGNALTIEHSENMTGEPGNSYVLYVSGFSVTLTEGTIYDNLVTYSISTPVTQGVLTTLNYTPGDMEGTQTFLEAFTNFPVTNGSTQPGLGGLVERYDLNAAVKFQDFAGTTPVTTSGQSVGYVQGLDNNLPLRSSNDTIARKPYYLGAPYLGLYYSYKTPYITGGTSGQRFTYTDVFTFDPVKKHIVAISVTLTDVSNDTSGPEFGIGTTTSNITTLRILPQTGRLNLYVRSNTVNTTGFSLGTGQLTQGSKYRLILVYDGTAGRVWLNGSPISGTINVGLLSNITASAVGRLVSYGVGDFIAHRVGYWAGDAVDTTVEGIQAIDAWLQDGGLQPLTEWGTPTIEKITVNSIPNAYFKVSWPGKTAKFSGPEHTVEIYVNGEKHVNNASPYVYHYFTTSLSGHQGSLVGFVFDNSNLTNPGGTTEIVSWPPGTVIRIKGYLGGVYDSTNPADYAPDFDLSITV